MDRMMIPPAFGPPPQAQSPMGGMGQTPPPSNPMDLLAALKELAPPKSSRMEPMYRPGYKKPPKPDPMKVRLNGQKLYDQNRMWRLLVFTTLKWTRQDLTGMFPEDELERALGKQEEYISTALTDERNLIISKGSALVPNFRKRRVLDENRGYAQQLEDAALWVRDMERYKHVVNGNRPLELDEWALFTDYGMYAARDVLSPYDYECPVDMRLIDPAQVHPIYGRSGLEQVYRVYRDTSEEIQRNYGDFSDETLAKLKKATASEIGDGTEFDVTEYWDTWYRLVMIGDEVILAAEHKYGDVPYTIQYGGHGEPMFTRSPETKVLSRANGQFSAVDAGIGSERINKATPYLYARLKNHEIFEAVMGRVITDFKKSVNPATIRYRSDMAAEKPMPQLDGSPGAQNEAMLGEEKIEPLPTGNPQATSLVLGALQQDKMTGSAPPEMFGRMDKSNISSVAQAGANDAGMHLLQPDTVAWGMALRNRYSRIFRMLANNVDLVENAGRTKKSIVVPGRKGKSAYEFKREIVEKVGSDIDVTFTRIDPRDWPGLVAAAGPAIQSALIRPDEFRELMLGKHDWEDHFQEWQEQTGTIAMMSNPDFQKMNILENILSSIKENEGSPLVQEGYQRLYDLWMQIATPPQQSQQPGMPGGGGAPTGAPQQSGNPFPAPPGSVAVGGPGGVSQPSLGPQNAPGAQGGAVGRPY